MQEPPFADMPDSVRNIMKASIDQARKAFDTFIATSQQAMANMGSSPNSAVDNVRLVNEKIAEFTKTNADANFRFAMQLADAKNVNDVVEIQNLHARELMDTYAKQLEEIRQLTSRLLKDSVQAATSNMPNAPGGGHMS